MYSGAISAVIPAVMQSASGIRRRFLGQHSEMRVVYPAMISWFPEKKRLPGILVTSG